MLETKIFPPKDAEAYDFHREAYSPFVKVSLPGGGDEYSLLWEEFVSWFRRVCPAYWPRDRAQTYLFNFRKLRFFLETQDFIPL